MKVIPPIVKSVPIETHASQLYLRICIFCLFVLYCVCSNANLLHNYCFRFHARWIDGVECGLFSNHAPLGQTTLRVG